MRSPLPRWSGSFGAGCERFPVLSELALALGLVAGWQGSVQWSVAVLALLFLVHQEDRIVFAPVYGGGFLLVCELAQRAIELRGVQRLGPGVIGARPGAVSWSPPSAPAVVRR
ncbi:MAG: hypothetical protein ACR2MK_06800 [Solirubrobacteraceae bacterium]